MIRFCKVRQNHVCLGVTRPDSFEHECDGGCVRERETPAEVIASVQPVQLRVLAGDDKPLTHADAAPVRTAQVLRWKGITRHDLPVERILEGANEAGLKAIVILGYDGDGDEYFASSIADGADVLWLLERLKLQLLTTGADSNPV